ncbi:MAG: hypothetical protein PHG79_09050 [Methanosarcina sp.]|nr:hypothetical protein [Methanosarcina sp.]MDD3873228.1 hypothetical protein [Methanosarcina sp.]MDD4523183.1 hypothetical protein [Methanosarcina sp.]
MGNYGGLWGIMGDYGELWGIMGNYGELRRINRESPAVQDM